MLGRGWRVIAWALVGVGLSAGAVLHAAPVRVVATTTIVGDVVAAVGGQAIDLRVLLPRGADPHTFQATPRDLVLLSTAGVVFLNGAGLETVLYPLLDTTASDAVALSAGMTLRRLGDQERDDHGEDEGDWDPHVWLDPTLVMIWTERIADALAERDPANAVGYAARADTYRTALADLDLWIWRQLGGLPSERRQLVTDHASLGYFAARYGFTEIGAILPGFSTLAEPSARELAALEDRIRELGVTALFVEASAHPTLARQIADDTGVGVVRLFLGSLSAPNGPAASYLDLMRYNVTRIVDELGATEE